MPQRGDIHAAVSARQNPLPSSLSRDRLPSGDDDGHKVSVLQVEVERCRRALDALRKANPGIVIDGDDDALDWPAELLVPAEYETMPEGMLRSSALYSIEAWKKGLRLNKSFWPQPVAGHECIQASNV